MSAIESTEEKWAQINQCRAMGAPLKYLTRIFLTNETLRSSEIRKNPLIFAQEGVENKSGRSRQDLATAW